MKKRYVIALVLVIMVAVLLVVFRIRDSISTENKEVVTIPRNHNELIEFIKNEKDELVRSEKIDYYLKYNKITKDEVNNLY